MKSRKLGYLLAVIVVSIMCYAGVSIFYHITLKRLQIEPQDAVSSVDSQGNNQPGAEVSGGAVPPGEGISVIIRRNLFGSRAESLPVAEKDDLLDDIKASSLDVVLMGTVTGDANDQRAIIYDKKERRQTLYQEGDYIQGAAIKRIIRGKVILELDGQNEMLDIIDARNVVQPQTVASVKPITTARRVVSRPGVNAQAAASGSSQPGAGVSSGSANYGPRRSLREGSLIIKGRDTSKP